MQICWFKAMKGFVGDNQNLELNLVTDQLSSGCRMGVTCMFCFMPMTARLPLILAKAHC